MSGSRYWGLIPAAGLGTRMRSTVPKQFLKIGEKSIIEWTIDALAQNEKVDGLVVGLSDTDEHGAWIKSLHRKVLGIFQGGETRSQTVLNGIDCLLNNHVSENDWLLVHDANRPLVSQSEISKLIEEVNCDDDGGIISLPIHDTLKLGRQGRVVETQKRADRYRALTPQMFKLKQLQESLDHSIQNAVEVTDEAQAMEICGYKPKLVAGSALNIKITTLADLEFATMVIEARYQSKDVAR